jgi:hypothetical protein
MRINEILVESALEEGPILNKIGSGIGKVAGTVAKGVGAVAGGVAGLGSALKKGFQAGKQTVAGAGDVDPSAAPAAGRQSPAQASQGGAAPTTAAGINAQGPKGTAAAKTQTGAGAQALQKTAQATQNATADQAGQTVYAQVKANIDKLDKKGKQRIMQLLQKSVAAPAANPAAGGAMGQMANQLANTGASSTGGKMQGTATGVKNTANPNNPNLKQTGLPNGVDPVKANAAQQAGGLPPLYQQKADGSWEETESAKGTWVGDPGGASGITPAAKPRTRKPVNISGSKKAVQPQQQVASKEPKGNMVAEGFSIFRKR